MKKKTPTLRFC